MLLALSQVSYLRYNGKNIIIYTNMDVILFMTLSHMILMTRIHVQSEGENIN